MDVGGAEMGGAPVGVTLGAVLVRAWASLGK